MQSDLRETGLQERGAPLESGPRSSVGRPRGYAGVTSPLLTLTPYAFPPPASQVERETLRYLAAVSSGVAPTAAAVPLSYSVAFRQFAHPAITPFSAVGMYAPTSLMIAGIFALTFGAPAPKYI